jgi:hypothetical protein
MSATKEMFLRMREDDFNALSNEVRDLFTYVEVREANEYETHKHDINYLSLYKAQKKAKKDLQDYLYNKRNNYKP